VDRGEDAAKSRNYVKGECIMINGTNSGFDDDKSTKIKKNQKEVS
jgi:hypothetical protein